MSVLVVLLNGVHQGHLSYMGVLPSIKRAPTKTQTTDEGTRYYARTDTSFAYIHGAEDPTKKGKNAFNQARTLVDWNNTRTHITFANA